MASTLKTARADRHPKGTASTHIDTTKRDLHAYHCDESMNQEVVGYLTQLSSTVDTCVLTGFGAVSLCSVVIANKRNHKTLYCVRSDLISYQ